MKLHKRSIATNIDVSETASSTGSKQDVMGC